MMSLAFALGADVFAADRLTRGGVSRLMAGDGVIVAGVGVVAAGAGDDEIISTCMLTAGGVSPGGRGGANRARPSCAAPWMAAMPIKAVSEIPSALLRAAWLAGRMCVDTRARCALIENGSHRRREQFSTQALPRPSDECLSSSKQAPVG